MKHMKDENIYYICQFFKLHAACWVCNTVILFLAIYRLPRPLCQIVRAPLTVDEQLTCDVRLNLKNRWTLKLLRIAFCGLCSQSRLTEAEVLTSELGEVKFAVINRRTGAFQSVDSERGANCERFSKCFALAIPPGNLRTNAFILGWFSREEQRVTWRYSYRNFPSAPLGKLKLNKCIFENTATT